MAQRYAVHLPLDLGDVTPRFVATDTTTGQAVVIARVEPQWARLVRPGIGALHRHLTGLLDVIDSPNVEAFPSVGEAAPVGPFLVAELMRGRTLVDAVRSEPLIPDRAVAWTMRILDGLQALHRNQVAHGALSSHAIVIQPRGRPIAPVISQLVVPSLKDYASPERLTGGGPSIADDLWAAGLLLFEMLTGKLPFHAAASTWGRGEVNAADMDRVRAVPHGRELEVIVKRALSTDRSRRPGSAEEFLDLLDRWEQRIALPVTLPRAPPRVPNAANAGQPAPWDHLVVEFEGGGKRLDATLDAAEQMRLSVVAESLVQPTDLARSGHVDVVERPAPAEKSLARSNRPSSEERRRMPSFGLELAAFRERSKPKLGRLSLALGLLAMLGAVGFYFMGRRDEAAQAAIAASARPVVERVSVVSSKVPAARPHLSARQEQSLCIRSYFRPDAIADGTDLAFVCTEEDFLVVNRKLNDDTLVAPASTAGVAGSSSIQAVTEAGGKAVVQSNPAMVIRSGASAKGWQLGWYELVATAIIRQNCCREAAPIKLPESTGWCQQLQTVVRRIAADSAKVGDISPGVRAFDEAITCLMAQGRHAGYPYRAVPTSLQKSAFQQFLKHAAEVDARRTARR